MVEELAFKGVWYYWEDNWTGLAYCVLCMYSGHEQSCEQHLQRLFRPK